MGRIRNGHFVSGVCIAVAGATSPAPPPPPFTAAVVWAGQTPLPVTGASGVAQTVSLPLSYYPNVLSYVISGGVPPYTVTSTFLINNPSGKLSIVPAPDGVHNTIGWSDFAINEVQSTDIRATIHDSAGTWITDTYSGITVQRTT
jgi:hypothetical protein